MQTEGGTQSQYWDVLWSKLRVSLSPTCGICICMKWFKINNKSYCRDRGGIKVYHSLRNACAKAWNKFPNLGYSAGVWGLDGGHSILDFYVFNDLAWIGRINYFISSICIYEVLFIIYALQLLYRI